MLGNDVEEAKKFAAERAKKVKSHARRHKNKDKPWEILPIGLMPDVQETDYYFVAYSRRDYGMVYADMFGLQAEGINLWYDRGMEVGKDWRIVAERMINTHECKGVIVYVTENSMSSEAVQGELSLAFNLGKNIISINQKVSESAETIYFRCVQERKVTKDRVFETVLKNVLNASVTVIAQRISSAAKRKAINEINAEDPFYYDYDCEQKTAVLSGVKYVGLREAVVPRIVRQKEKDYLVVGIGVCAFANCRHLESVVVADDLYDIGEYAFCNCLALNKMVGFTNIRRIGSNAFKNCKSLSHFELSDKLICVEDGIFKGCSSLEAVSLGESLTSIGTEALSGCSSLTSIKIPDSVKMIGRNAFCGCIQLKSIRIGDGVQVIGENAFMGCSMLKEIFLPKNLRVVENKSFFGCKSLEAVDGGSSLERVGAGAFWGCRRLGSLVLADSVRVVEDAAFAYCGSLRMVRIPHNVYEINNQLFSRCDQLICVSIHEKIKHIGAAVFYKCDKLTSILYEGTKEEWRNVDKSWGWHGGRSFAIYCTDGKLYT